MSPYALTAGLAELTSGIVLLWYWKLVRPIPLPHLRSIE